MNLAWLDRFLPIWLFTSLFWVVAGFIMMPNAFRLPLIANPGLRWMSRMYDPTNIDWSVARQLLVIFGPPTLAITTAAVIFTVQLVRYKRTHPPPFRS
jgi:hypothetical protein